MIRPGRRPPRLLVVVPLESHGRIVLDAETLEDEQRLLSWLRRASVLEELREALEQLLDETDWQDAA